MTDIAIIGSGISALTIAHALKDAANVTIFEKSPGTGGRMATRRAA
ncbi:MAG: NAD(P)-binding protein, partial [Pseudomonadota bacterium]|nr:NAD(P)-binding protein [Pseudomonadota bacterium]